MRVTVFGPGGVGGYLAARLAASGTADVSVVARGAHLAAIARDGLRLESPHGDLAVRVAATDDPADIGVVDLVLLTVKTTDVAEATAALAPLLGADSVVLTLQNGVDSPRIVAEEVGAERVLPGVAYVFSTIASPGVVRHTAGPGRVVFGEREGPPGRALRVGELLSSAGVPNEVVDDVDAAMWSKFALICSTAGVTACSRLPIDQLRQVPATHRLFRALARETVEVGRACGVALPDATVEDVMGFVDDVGPDAYSSLLYDLVHGKPMELRSLHGAVLRLAEEHGVDVPATRTVHALLEPWARRNAAQAPPG